MEYRYLGHSGLKVPVLSLGTSTFGGSGEFFSAWGDTDVDAARRMVDICLDAGLNLFDSADVYSEGAAEEILGAAVKGRRDQVLISTKMTLALSSGPNDSGSSRYRMITAVEKALKRLDTDYIDLLQLHGFDGFTPVEEVLHTFDTLIRDGKVRYVGASNYAGWQLMKSLAAADKHGWPRYISHQVYYSLLGRDYEWELMPLGLDQGVGAMVWSPLAWGRLTGKIRRNQPPPEGSRVGKVGHWMMPVDDEVMFDLVDVMEEIAEENDQTIAQVALAWILSRPSVSTVILGARNEEQLRDNLGAVGWTMSKEQLERLNNTSAVTPPYPYFAYGRDRSYMQLSPPPVPRGKRPRK